MSLQELHIGYSAFPSCLLPVPGVAVLLLQRSHHLTSHHSPTQQPGCSHLPWHFHTSTSFCSLLSFSLIAWQSSALAYFFIFSFVLFMGLYTHASSFPLLLSLMHFLCHSVLQASHVERPAFPQIPSSLPVSTLTVPLSHCPKNSFFSKLENSSKHSFCTVKKQKLFHLHFKRKQCSWERGIFADVELHTILPTGPTGCASEEWQTSYKVTFEHFGKWFRLFSALFRCNLKVFGGLFPTSYKDKIAANLMFWCFLEKERKMSYMVTIFKKMHVYF